MPIVAFCIKKDMAKSFFCQACLIGKAKSEQSPDCRYCKSCAALLVQEAKLSTAIKTPRWSPRKTASDATKRTRRRLRGSTASNKLDTQIKSTSKRSKKLPIDFIKQLAERGLGITAICNRLQVKGFKTSYKTIQRMLN